MIFPEFAKRLLSKTTKSPFISSSIKYLVTNFAFSESKFKG